MKTTKLFLIMAVMVFTTYNLNGCYKGAEEIREPITFTVQFDSKGGSAIMPLSLPEGSKITKPADPVKNGFYFKGWQKDPATGATLDFERERLQESIVLQAKWDTIPSSDREIQLFSINGFAGEIYGKNIKVTLPYDTDLVKLYAVFTINGKYLTVNDIIQESGQTANDFTKPVKYTVYAENGENALYVVNVNTEKKPVQSVTSEIAAGSSMPASSINSSSTESVGQQTSSSLISSTATIKTSECNLIANGSFEQPMITNSKKWEIYKAEELQGWKIEWINTNACPTNKGNRIEPVLEYQKNLKTLAAEGLQYAELDSDCQGPLGGNTGIEKTTIKLYQDIKTEKGKTYKVTFEAARRIDGKKTDPMSLSVFWGESVILKDRALDTKWTKFSYTVTAAGDITRLSFIDTGYPDSFGVFLDNVKVTDSYCGMTPCQYAGKTVSVKQGLKKNGDKVNAERSNTINALGKAEGNDAVNKFFTLGYGGEVVFELDGYLFNRAGNVLQLVETSYGNPSCSTYPEKAEVYASQNGLNWTYLGQGCLDSKFSLGNLPWAKYIKVKDVTTSVGFDAASDGFDIDGLVCINE